MSKKKKSKCNYFRITDDLKNVTIVVAKNQTEKFLNYLKEISSEIRTSDDFEFISNFIGSPSIKLSLKNLQS